MNIRPLRATDLDAVVGIEQQYMPSPWSPTLLRAEFETANGLSLVVECKQILCGYAFFRTCAPECELLHLVVDPAWRRRGAGMGLLNHGLSTLTRLGHATCYLEVRRSNEAALHLYAKVGFCQVGQRKNYYSQPVEDALLLSRDLRNWT